MKTRHQDIIQWCISQKAGVKAVRDGRRKEEKGFVAYFNDIRTFIQEYRGTKKDVVKPENTAKAEASEGRALYQAEASRELLKRMKWKRVTWEENADYSGFSTRILSCDDLFKKVPAFSFMSLKVVQEPIRAKNAPKKDDKVGFEAGDLTGGLCADRVKKEPLFVPAAAQLPPFVVDWKTAEVKFLDSATPQELLSYLKTVAPQVQAAQVRNEEQIAKIVADVDNARIRLGAMRIVFNDHNVTFWDDPQAKINENYVTPDHMKMFLEGVLRGATFYRWYLGGHQIRVVHPSQPYAVDTKTNEIRIPANFAEFNWMPFHSRAQAFESVFEFQRRIWWLWFAGAVMFVGDLELL